MSGNKGPIPVRGLDDFRFDLELRTHRIITRHSLGALHIHRVVIWLLVGERHDRQGAWLSSFVHPNALDNNFSVFHDGGFVLFVMGSPPPKNTKKPQSPKNKKPLTHVKGFPKSRDERIRTSGLWSPRPAL